MEQTKAQRDRARARWRYANDAEFRERRKASVQKVAVRKRAENNAYALEYRAKNADMLRAKRAAKRVADPEAYRVKKRAETLKYKAHATARARAYRAANVAKMLLEYARHRAKKRGLEFDLTLEDIVIPELCPVFRKPLTRKLGDKTWSPSIDRVDNARGYVRGNIVVMSLRANDLKRTASLSEMIALGVWACKRKAVR